jgi:hypothetical protein
VSARADHEHVGAGGLVDKDICGGGRTTVPEHEPGESDDD